jgi:hypothetical protein
MSGIGILAILGRRSIDRRLNEERRADFASGARIAAAALVFLIGSGLFSMILIYKNDCPEVRALMKPNDEWQPKQRCRGPSGLPIMILTAHRKIPSAWNLVRK